MKRTKYDLLDLYHCACSRLSRLEPQVTYYMLVCWISSDQTEAHEVTPGNRIFGICIYRNYCYPVSELMSQVSGLSKLIAILIASPHFKAQKPITCLNISVMAFCVRRNGWFSFSHTQFSSHLRGAHAMSSGYSYSLITLHSRLYICIYFP